MIGQDTREVERKVIAILKVLGDSPEPVGARVIARRLKEQGIDLTERAVRYHLKLMDERGFTQGRGRDGRLITPSGREELRSALVQDKVGFVIAKIELLAYRTSFDVEKRSGEVPINTTFFPKKRFREALEAMKDAFSAGLCVSDLVAVASEGERLGESIVPEGMVGLATVCSIVVNGVLLKSGVPMNSKFGGILQIRKGKPLRFVELIEYSGTSLDPSEVFITSRMTSVGEVATRGEGKILANFREIPAPSRPVVERVIQKLSEANLGGVVTIGETSEPVCEIPVGLNKIGMILLGGLNPVAAAVERGVEGISRAMSGVMDFHQLQSFWTLYRS